MLLLIVSNALSAEVPDVPLLPAEPLTPFPPEPVVNVTVIELLALVTVTPGPVKFITSTDGTNGVALNSIAIGFKPPAPILDNNEDENVVNPVVFAKLT